MSFRSHSRYPGFFPTGGSLVLWLLIALLWGVLYSLTPIQLDDWQFIGTYRDHNEGSIEFSLSSWGEYAADLRKNDNGRLSNILSPLSTIWRPWNLVFPWITGVAVATVVWLVTRIGFGRDANWRGMSLVWILIAVFLPWRDSMLVRDYSLNYVWGAFVTLWAVILTMRALHGNNGTFLWAFIAVIFAGAWHEGFAVPTLCGLGAVALLNKFKMGVRWWTLIAAYTVVGAAFALSPGMLERSSRSSVGMDNILNIRYFVDIFPLILLLVSSAVMMLFASGRCRLTKLFGKWEYPVFLTASVVGVAITLVFDYSPRACFWPSLCAIVALVVLLRSIWFRFPRWCRGVIAVLCAVVCTAHLLLSIRWQYRFHGEAERIVSSLKTSATGTVFAEVTPKSAVPKWTLGYPSRLMWLTPFNMLSMGHAFGDRNLAVVPTSLRDAGLSSPEARRIDSNLDLRLSPDGKALFAAPAKRFLPAAGDPLYIDEPARADVVFADGLTVSGMAVPLFFYVNQPGDTLLYLATPDVDPARIKSLYLK